MTFWALKLDKYLVSHHFKGFRLPRKKKSFNFNLFVYISSHFTICISENYVKTELRMPSKTQGVRPVAPVNVT